MKTQRGGIGALMLYLTAQTGAAFSPAIATAADAVKATPQAQAPAVTRLVLADASWDAFVFVSAAAAVALEIAAADEPVALESASWAFQSPEPQFDYLAALSDVGIAAPQADAPQMESHWLS